MKPKSRVSPSGPVDNLDWARHAQATDEVLAGLHRRARQRAARRWMVGSALMVALVGGAVWQVRSPEKSRPETPTAVASALTVIQPRTQALPDGSVVELKDGAKIAVVYSEALRRVELLQGAAHFAVAKNPARPFVVVTRGIGVRAVGTAFAVDASAQSVAVVVTEGKVALEAPSPTGSPLPGKPVVLGALTAGHRSVVQPDSATAPVEILDEQAMRTALSWRIPRIDFSRAPLSQVVAEMNKHNRTQMVFADDAVGRFQISGALQADRVEGLIEMLAADFGLLADRSAGQIVLRRGK